MLDGITQGQSVMLATNEIMAPRSTRVIDMRKVGH
jgi:hypothetical protein